MARDQVLSLRADPATYQVLRNLPAEEGSLSDVAEAVAQAITLTTGTRSASGESFRDWLLAWAQCEDEHPEAEDGGATRSANGEAERQALAQERQTLVRQASEALERAQHAERDLLAAISERLNRHAHS